MEADTTAAPETSAPEAQTAQTADPAARNAARRARMQGSSPRPGGPSTPIEVSADDLEDDDVDALSGAPGEETIRIGEVDVPLSALSALPDDVLKRIKRKIKAAGEEREISLADALEAVPKAEGWRKRMWEASQKEQHLERLAQQMGTDPVGAYAALHKVSRSQAMDALSEKYMREIEIERMTPEERAKADRQAELERKAARAEELERAEKDRRLQAEAEGMQRQFVAATKPALEAAGLKASKRNVQQVALLVDRAIRDGVIHGVPTADDFGWAAKELAKEIAEERDDYLPTDAEGDALIERIGVERARKIAQAYAKRVRKAAPAVERKREGTAPRRSNTQPSTWEEWRAAADRRQGIRR